MNYAAEQIREQLKRGTQPDENFYRMKVTGNGSTMWFNVTAEQLEMFAAQIENKSNLERQRELATSILALDGSIEVRETGKPTRSLSHYAPELAKLVLNEFNEKEKN